MSEKITACIKEESENFQRLIKNRDFVNRWGADKFPIILMALHADPANFQAIIKIPDLKLVILEIIGRSKIILLEYILKGEAAYDNLIAISNDRELKACFFPKVLSCLVSVAKNQPDSIQKIITHPDFKKYMPFVITDILFYSQSKKDADLVFADPETFGSWGEGRQKDIYMKIEDNYRWALLESESLSQHSLFAVKEDEQVDNKFLSNIKIGI